MTIDFEQEEAELLILAVDEFRSRLRNRGLLDQLGIIESALTKLRKASDEGGNNAQTTEWSG
jgi:hypothetical protein